MGHRKINARKVVDFLAFRKLLSHSYSVIMDEVILATKELVMPVTVEDILGECREPEFVYLRQLVWVIAKDHFEFNHSEISRYGKKHRATIIHGIAAWWDRYGEDEERLRLLRGIINRLELRIKRIER